MMTSHVSRTNLAPLTEQRGETAAQINDWHQQSSKISHRSKSIAKQYYSIGIIYVDYSDELKTCTRHDGAWQKWRKSNKKVRPRYVFNTTARDWPKMNFSLSAVNENDTENNIPFRPKTKRKRKWLCIFGGKTKTETKVDCLPVKQTTSGHYGKRNIFGPPKMTFRMKTKKKTETKRNRPKTTKYVTFGAVNENEIRSITIKCLFNRTTSRPQL